MVCNGQTDRQMDRQTNGQRLKKWHTEVDVPPNNQYEELLEKNNTHTVMGNRTYRWKQPSLDHLQTPKQNQKEYLSKIGYKVGGGAYFNVFLGTTSERLNP